MANWYIYALIDPRTGDVRYIGKRLRLQKRIQEHLRDQRSSRRAEWVRSLRALNLSPVLLVLEEGDGDWCASEQRWIASYRSSGADLTNATYGSEGLRGASARTRQKIAAAQRARWSGELRERLLEVARHPERRAAISRALTGKKKSAEHIANLPQNQRGYDWSLLIREQRRAILLTRAMPVARAMTRSPAQFEHLKHMQEANIGTPGWARGRVLSERERAARSAALLGRPKTAEHRERIRQAALRRWAKVREAQARLE